MSHVTYHVSGVKLYTKNYIYFFLLFLVDLVELDNKNKNSKGCLMVMADPTDLGHGKNKPATHAAHGLLTDATPPTSKIHLFSKITITFEPITGFDVL